MMNSTSNSQISSTNKEYSQPQRQFFKHWKIIPVLMTPVLIAGSFYLSAQQVTQARQSLATERTESQQAIAKAQQDAEATQAQLKALQQQHQATQTQLQATHTQQADLQTSYADALNRIDSLEIENQELKPLKAQRDTLKGQVKQLQKSNATLKNQGKSQSEQVKTLQNRFKAIEKQKQQLQAENQKLRLASSQLEALKPELAQAHRTIELLSVQLGKKPDQMATVDINGEQFTVTPELAAALNAQLNARR